MTVSDVYKILDELAPFSDQLAYDNAGLQIGSLAAPVTKALVCLDVTAETLSESQARGAELILSHHPLLFHPARRIETESVLWRAVQSGATVLSAHTNLDKSPHFGPNDALARALRLENVRGILPDGTGFLALCGELPEALDADALAKSIRTALNLSHLEYTPAEKPIRRVAVIGGAGGEFAEAAALSGADAVLTGEVKHHEWLAARAMGFALYAAGHAETELPFRPLLAAFLREKLPGIEFFVSETERVPTKTV